MTPPNDIVAPVADRRRPRRLREALGPLRLLALAYVVVLVALTALAPVLPFVQEPSAQDIAHRLQGPGAPGHLLGTDLFGRDSLARLIHGGRVELVIALGATALALVLGTTLGLVGGFYGRLASTLTMRTVDVVLAFPPVVLALLVVTINGPGALTLIVVMGVLFSPAYARLVFGQVMAVRSMEYVEASLVFGTPRWRTLLTVVLPNVATPLIVQVPLTLAASILLESGLSYLGLGVVPPTPSWGYMVAEGQRFLSSDPGQVLLPSAVIAVTILAFGFVGDTLRDWLDPRRSMARSYR